MSRWRFPLALTTKGDPMHYTNTRNYQGDDDERYETWNLARIEAIAESIYYMGAED